MKRVHYGENASRPPSCSLSSSYYSQWWSWSSSSKLFSSWLLTHYNSLRVFFLYHEGQVDSILRPYGGGCDCLAAQRGRQDHRGSDPLRLSSSWCFSCVWPRARNRCVVPNRASKTKWRQQHFYQLQLPISDVENITALEFWPVPTIILFVIEPSFFQSIHHSEEPVNGNATTGPTSTILLEISRVIDSFSVGNSSTSCGVIVITQARCRFVCESESEREQPFVDSTQATAVQWHHHHFQTTIVVVVLCIAPLVFDNKSL